MVDTHSAKPSKVFVATPNIGASSSTVRDTVMTTALGSRIRLQLVAPVPRKVEGTLFAISAQYQMIVLLTSLPSSTSDASYNLIPLSAIQKFDVLSLKPTPVDPSILKPLDHKAIQDRLKSAVERLKAEDARKGKGVTKEGQAIFDAISRTLPTRWNGENIIVSDAVMIEPPYRPEDCRSGSGVAAQSLPRVKKVLENERKKLVEKTNITRPAVPAAVPLGALRKGG